MTYVNGNFGITYQPSNHQSMGVNTRLTKYEHKHNIDDGLIRHYTSGLEDFRTDNQTFSKNKPTQWLTNLFYSLTAGKTRLELTDDILMGEQRNSNSYKEKTSAGVTTYNKAHYWMNSFVADFNTTLSAKLTFNYGVELTYSFHKQDFDFTASDIHIEMQKANNKNQQLLVASFANLRASLGKFALNGGLRYEYANWAYFIGNHKQKTLSRIYNNLFPTLNLSYNPTNVTSLSLGYRQTVRRPGYADLNDNVQYQSRYYSVQGNSLLDYAFTHSITLLTSHKTLRFIGSIDCVSNDMAVGRTIIGSSQDVVLARTINIDDYMRWTAGANWWKRFGIYTPYLELGVGGQSFSFTYQNEKSSYNHPFINFKLHHTFNLKNLCDIMLFVDYYGKNYSLFREVKELWNTQLSLSKSIHSWYVQLSLNNALSPRSRTSITRASWVEDVSFSNRDNRSLSLFISHTFNNKQRKHNANTKSSEINRF